jgi:hypothetical protein
MLLRDLMKINQHSMRLGPRFIDEMDRGALKFSPQGILPTICGCKQPT